MRLIDADSVMMDILSAGKIGKLMCIDLIKHSKTVDAVPVVRCRDCKHSRTPETPSNMLKRPDVLKCGCRTAPCSARLVYPTDFCRYGERKEANNE